MPFPTSAWLASSITSRSNCRAPRMSADKPVSVAPDICRVNQIIDQLLFDPNSIGLHGSRFLSQLLFKTRRWLAASKTGGTFAKNAGFLKQLSRPRHRGVLPPTHLTSAIADAARRGRDDQAAPRVLLRPPNVPQDYRRRGYFARARTF